MITRPPSAQAEGEGDYIDLSEHQMVSFRVFGDGRKYIANFRTENWIVGSRNHDVWQAFLFARRGASTTVVDTLPSVA